MQYLKTAKGQLALKARLPVFSARQRAFYILFNGVKTVEQLLATSRGLGVTRADVDYFVIQGLLELVPLAQDSVASLQPETDAGAMRRAGERYLAARAMATPLTATLGLRGLMLNMAVESADGYDDLLALLPKIRAAVGDARAQDLETALIG